MRSEEFTALVSRKFIQKKWLVGNMFEEGPRIFIYIFFWSDLQILYLRRVQVSARMRMR